MFIGLFETVLNNKTTDSNNFRRGDVYNPSRKWYTLSYQPYTTKGLPEPKPENLDFRISKSKKYQWRKLIVSVVSVFQTDSYML